MILWNQALETWPGLQAHRFLGNAVATGKSLAWVAVFSIQSGLLLGWQLWLLTWAVLELALDLLTWALPSPHGVGWVWLEGMALTWMLPSPHEVGWVWLEGMALTWLEGMVRGLT